MPRQKISVLILYNSPQPSGHGQAFAESEAGVLGEVKAVEQALDRLRIPHRVVGVRRFGELPALLAAADEPVVFNLVEGFWTDAAKADLVPAVIGSFGKACTGNDSRGMLLSLDKWQSKTLLRAAGLPTPQGMVVRPGHRVPTKDLFDGPYIVKPMQADGSEGIDKTSVIDKRGKALGRIVQRIHDGLAQPALIEQYIDGRELNISVISRDGEQQVLPLAEIEFRDFGADRPRIVGYEAKWLEDSFEYRHTPHVVPAPLPKRVAQQVRELAAAACRTLACLDYCRVDFRLDRANRPYILEVNSNPDISPEAGFAAALQAAGISYEAFVRLSIDNALARVPRETSRRTRPQRTRTGKAPGAPAIEIRWCRPEDRQVVLSFLAETGFFQPGEIDVAREVLDAGLAEGPEGHYQSFVACVNQETVGWICYGPTPCTIGTFDIYWIGVAPAWQGRGIGRSLTVFAEQAIARRAGRLAVIETSSRETYHPTRQFYLAMGYHEAARIAEFYGPGDHRVVLVKDVRSCNRVSGSSLRTE